MQERQRNKAEKLKVLRLISACVESNVSTCDILFLQQGMPASGTAQADMWWLYLQAITQKFEVIAGRSAMVSAGPYCCCGS